VLHVASWKCRTQKAPKIRHLGTIAQLCRAISSQLRHISTIGTNVKQQYLPPTFPHNMVNFGALAAEIISAVLGIPASFNGFRVFASLLSDVSQRKSTKLCTMFGSLYVLVHYVYIFGALAPQRNFARCKVHFSSMSCALLYWQRYCAALE